MKLKKLKISLMLGTFLTAFAALPAFADGACGNRCVDDACAEQVVALTYPEPYDGEDRIRQRVTIGVVFPAAPPPRWDPILPPPPKPAPRPPRWVPVRPGPPRPVGPPPRPVSPPPRFHWILW